MNQPAPEPAWRWPEERWRAAVEAVRAGKSLRPKKWKGGARLAVAIAVEADHETLGLAHGGQSAAALAEGQFGARQGMPRLIALLRRQNVPATVFLPAVAALLHPEATKALVAGGHEVALHSWCHEDVARIDAESERSLLTGAREAIARIVGVAPVGYRAASGELTVQTLTILRDCGILYDATLCADDDAAELLVEGAPSGIVALPASRTANDELYFGGPVPMAAESAFEALRRELETAYDEGGLFMPTFHPGLIGRRARLWVLDELIKIARSLPGVWFATHTDVALWVKSRAG